MNKSSFPHNFDAKLSFFHFQSYQKGVHLPKLDKTVKNLTQKPFTRRASVHSVKSDHSLTSVKHAISDMAQEVHSKPNLLAGQTQQILQNSNITVAGASNVGSAVNSQAHTEGF